MAASRDRHARPTPYPPALSVFLLRTDFGQMDGSQSASEIGHGVLSSALVAPYGLAAGP